MTGGFTYGKTLWTNYHPRRVENEGRPNHFGYCNKHFRGSCSALLQIMRFFILAHYMLQKTNLHM